MSRLLTSRAAPVPIAFFATPPHACSYLDGRQAVTVFADPTFHHDRRTYTALSRHGFRRSGPHIYRPHCPGCDACIPVRVPVNEFQPRRSQRRVWRANQDVRVTRVAPGFTPEHYALYARYVNTRHLGGGMDSPTPGQYLDFLTSLWSETTFYEFRAPSGLLAVGVVDRLDDGLSAVYTFFDPAASARSPGVFAVLWEVEEARRLGLEWLYLGYWLRESPKMRYKGEYQPLECLRDGLWRRCHG